MFKSIFMYHEISFRKVFIMGTIALVIVVSVIFTIELKNRYSSQLAGFAETIQSLPQLLAYRYAYSVSTSHPSLAVVAETFLGSLANVNHPIDLIKTASVPVLAYHGLVNKTDNINMTPDQFKEQMFALKKAGYTTISIHDLYDFLRGVKALPEKSFLLTFDDGRRDSYYGADAILNALNYTAVMFDITNTWKDAKGPNAYYLSSDELQAMVRSGRWEIDLHTDDGHDEFLIDGNGTKGHFFSDALWLPNKGRIETEDEFRTRVINDAKTGYQKISQLLGVPPLGFAFPFGDYGQETVNLPQAQKIILTEFPKIFPLLFTQISSGEFTANYPNPTQGSWYMVKRIEPPPSMRGNELIAFLENGKAKQLPITDDFTSDQGWRVRWGSIGIANGLFSLAAPPTSTGGVAFLDGTALFTNYEFEATYASSKGQSFSLVAHYSEDGLVSCDFTADDISLRETAGNNVITVQKIKRPSRFVDGTRVGIWILGGRAGCTANGKTIIIGDEFPIPISKGGIGFKVWDPVVGLSKVAFRDISVREITTEPL